MARPGDVQVYMLTAPEGFTLASNELEVKEGYGHKILGNVRVKLGGGECMAGLAGSVGKQDLIAAMQKTAWASGGNAVIYADAEWDDTTSLARRCTAPGQDPVFAAGWVVALSAPAHAAEE